MIDILASAVGSLTNPARISATFGSVLNSSIDEATVKRYIEYLEDAFLVSESVVKPYMDNDGILTMGLFDFLLDQNSLDM